MTDFTEREKKLANAIIETIVPPMINRIFDRAKQTEAKLNAKINALEARLARIDKANSGEVSRLEARIARHAKGIP
jgi:hypothetical protein